MRKKERLDTFYDELKEIHKEYFQDWRFGQFMINVFGEMQTDPFFPEEDKMLEIIKDYAKKYGIKRKDDNDE